jgi:hypothetical protein
MPDTPFKFDPSTDKLVPQFDAIVKTEISNATNQLKQLTQPEIEAQLKFFETKFPNKISSISGLLSDEERLIKFVERLIFDDAYEQQLLYQSQQPAPKPIPTPKPTPKPVDKDFKYNPSTDVLNPEFEAEFIKQFTDATNQINQLTTNEIDAKYKELETKYPKKFASITGIMNDKQKVMMFLQRQIFDEVFQQQKIKENTALFNIPKTPKKQPDAYDIRKRDLVKLLKDDLVKIYDSKFGKFPQKGTKRDQIIEEILIDEFGVKMHEGKKVGNGLSNRMIFGRGIENYETPVEVRRRKYENGKKIINGKFIDLNKLNNNIITIRYVSTGALIPTVKVQSISKDVKEIVEDIINDKFEKRLFEKLDMNEKRLIKRIITALNLDINLHDNSDEEFVKQFNIVLGQFRAGNNNVAIKRKLREYISEANECGMLPRREMQKLIFEIANSD